MSEAAGRADWSDLGGLLQDGLVIIGWVALWRPAEIFLYDWWPLRGEVVRYGILSRIAVRVLPG